MGSGIAGTDEGPLQEAAFQLSGRLVTREIPGIAMGGPLKSGSFRLSHYVSAPDYRTTTIRQH